MVKCLIFLEVKLSLWFSFLIVFSLCFLVFIFPRAAYASVLFYDNFGQGDLLKWEEAQGDASWAIEDDRLKGTVGGHFQVGNIVPKDEFWNSSWRDFIFVVEIEAYQGADRNISMLFQDESNRYGIHRNDSGIFFEKRVNGIIPISDRLFSECDLQDGIVYRFKFVKNGNRIKIFLDNYSIEEPIFDFNDEEPFLGEDTPVKIGLRVGTGAADPPVVYFDNVIVCTLDDPYNCDYPEEYFEKSPVILIPGHGSSMNFSEMFLGQKNPDGWQMMPGVHIYDNLLNTLEDNGYEKDRDLFTFYYNWLNPIASSSAELHDFILPIAATSPTGKVDIIGHSMGGLVGRACVQNNDDQCYIDRLITVGTPHKGVLEAYGAWEGGEVWRSGLSKLAFELFLNTKRQMGETKKEAIRKIAPSTEEMLPVFPYLKDINGNFLSQQPPNSYLGNNSLSRFLQAVDDNGKFIYGKDQSTLRWLTVTKNLSWVDKILGNWQQYGKPIRKEYSSDGDGTVLELSANPQEAGTTNSIGFPLGHSEIVSQGKAVEEIMEGLDLEATSSGDFQDNAQNYLVFYFHSPAHLEIANLPLEDVFLGEDNNGKLKLVIIANPQIDDNYSVGVVGDDSGEYTLTVGEVSGEQSNWDNYRGLTTVGEKDTFLIKFDPTVGQAQLSNVKSSIEELPLDELIAGLKEIFTTQSKELAQKMDNLESLTSISPEKSWEYIYQIRNLTASLYKSGQIDLDIKEVNSQLDGIAVYLKALAKNKPRVLVDGETELNLQDAQEIINNLAAVPYSNIEYLEKKFSLAAAFDFSLAQESLEEASGSSYPAYLLARKSYFLGRNSKALIQ